MSALLIQKAFVAILLLSMIPGFIWGWNDSRHEELPGRIFLGFVGSLLPPTAIATVAVILAVIIAGFAYLFS